MPRRARQRRLARAFYCQLVPSGALCFDVGANFGDRTAVFLALGARLVVAVEPQPRCLDVLQQRFGRSSRVALAPVALGAPGTEAAELAIADWSTIATMSSRWRSRVVESGRFGGDRWTDRIVVQVETLDALIAEYGVPDFCKIDVEGYEEEVLAGLSRPVPALSVEFTPEFEEASRACIDRLSDLGFDRFNVSYGETMRFAGDWTDAAGALRLVRASGGMAGDVYARAKTLS